MAEMYTTAEWIVKEGHEQAFVEAWTEFASWGNSMAGAGVLRLSRDLTDEARFVSFGLWDSVESAHRWKADPGFPPRMAKVQEHVAKFGPAELELVRAVGDDREGAGAGS